MDAILSYARKQEDDFYFILGCDETSTVEQINAEFKARVLDVHPDKNPDDPQAEERFKKLQLARDVLTDPEKRKKYDTWRGNSISMPFEQWAGLSKNVHTSLHWASRKKDLMLEGSGSHSSASGPPPVHRGVGLSAPNPGDRRRSEHWEREQPGASLQKFRNYEI
ncbi:DnaJ sub C member 12 [Chamberlinius hualienensis]